MSTPGALQHQFLIWWCWILVVFAVSGDAAETSAIRSEFISRNWQREDGLPDNSVQAILQTQDGYLWIGTARGLARYDGLKFTVFDRANTPELKSDDITCLAEDTEGHLWIGTSDGLAMKSGWNFVRFTEADGLCRDKQIDSLYARQQGGMWVGSHHGVTLLVEGRITCYAESTESGMSDMASLFEDKAGVLWVGAAQGLLRLNPASGQIEHIAPVAANPGMAVRAIQPASDGGLWALCFNESIYTGWVYRFKDEQWAKASAPLLFHPRSLFLCPSRNGNLWLSSHGGRVDSFRDGQFTPYSLNQAGAQPVPQCACEDREGNLWIGTENAGLYRWQPRRALALAKKDGLAYDNAWTICETHDGSLWIGTDGGLSRYRHGAFTNFTVAEGLPKNIVRALAEDRSGRLWVGTGSGLACLEAGRLIRHQFEGEWFSSKVRALLVDGQNQLWVGSANGLHRMPLPEAGFATPGNRDGRVIDPDKAVTFQTKEGLPHNDVSALLEDRLGAIWIGTSGGLCRMLDGRINLVAPTNGLASGNVGVLYEDRDGVLWIGAERGLYRHQDGRFTAYATREGLFDDVINSILEDDRGHLWFGGDRGIYRIAKAEFDAVAAGRASSVTPVVYSEADGLPSNETNGQKSQPAGCKTRDGRLWFPTTKGVVVFDPQHLPDNTNPPPVVIEHIRANGQIVYHDGASNEFSVRGLTHPLTPTLSPNGGEGARRAGEGVARNARLTLPPGAANVLEFQYTANSFITPERIRFKYRLDGQDKDWVDAGSRRTAYYTNLRPGDYRFRVAAANSHGVWNETGAALALHVAPHYYQTLTFRLACMLGATLLVLGLYRWRVGELRKLQRLEQATALTAERTRIAKDLHDGLGANLTHLTLLADLAEQEPAEAHSLRMRSLAASSREAARSLKDFLWTTHPSDEAIDGLVERICQHAEEFLETARIRCRFVLPEELPAHPLPAAARQSLFLVAREALNNVAKHSSASEVTIRTSADGGTFTLEIEDNGQGFNPQPSTHDSQPPRTGRGLGNMRSRIEEAGGRFTLESRPGFGTRIVIQLPLNSLRNEGS